MGKAHPKESYEILRLSEAFRRSWARDTAYPGDQDKWCENNPTVGQCAVTSALVQERLGGVIHKNNRFHHYWNEVHPGAIVDLTRDQFGEETEIPSEGRTIRNPFLGAEGHLLLSVRELS